MTIEKPEMTKDERFNSLITTMYERFHLYERAAKKEAEEADKRFDILARAMSFSFELVDGRLEIVKAESTQHGVMQEVADDKIVALAEGHRMLYDKVDRAMKSGETNEDRLNRIEGKLNAAGILIQDVNARLKKDLKKSDTRLKRVEKALRLNSGAV